MNIWTTLLTYLDIILATLYIFICLHREKYDTYLAVVLAIVISTAYMGTLYTYSLFFNLDYTLILIFQLGISFVFTKNLLYFKNLPCSIDYRIICLLWLGLVLFMIFSKRWGEWDAWAIWTLHAKFLYYPDMWTNMFAKEMNWSHTDYPLLLPAVTAMFWRSLHGIYAFVPATIALANFFMILFILFSGVRQYFLTGVIVSLLLMADFNFMDICASQYADSHVALMYLLVILLLTERPKGYIILAGILCSIALSIKNEGYIFFMVVFLYITISHRHCFTKTSWFLLSALPLFLTAFYFKITYAPDNDILSGQSISTLDKFLSPYRYFHIIRFGLETLIAKYYSLFILLLLCYKYILKIPKEYKIILFTLVAYLLIYLVTPRDLIWHMGTSMKRLFHHLYPASIYLLLKGTDLKIFNEILKSKWELINRNVKQ